MIFFIFQAESLFKQASICSRRRRRRRRESVLRTDFSNTKSNDYKYSVDFTKVRLTESCILESLNFQLINVHK